MWARFLSRASKSLRFLVGLLRLNGEVPVAKMSEKYAEKTCGEELKIPEHLHFMSKPVLALRRKQLQVKQESQYYKA